MCSKCAGVRAVTAPPPGRQPWPNQYNKLSLGKLVTAGLLITTQIFKNTGKWLNRRQGVYLQWEYSRYPWNTPRLTVDKCAQPLRGTFPFPTLLNLYTFRAILGFLNDVTTSERHFGCCARPAVISSYSSSLTFDICCEENDLYACTVDPEIAAHNESDKTDAWSSIWW